MYRNKEKKVEAEKREGYSTKKVCISISGIPFLPRQQKRNIYFKGKHGNPDSASDAGADAAILSSIV